MPSTYVDQTNLLWSKLDNRDDLALDWLEVTEGSLGTVREAIKNAVERLTSAGLQINVNGVNTTYSGPSSSLPQSPGTDGVAISDEDWNAIYLRAQGLQDRVSVRRQWEASNMAAARGHTRMSESELAALRRANFEDDARASENALISATEQAKAKREDAVNLYAQEIAAWQAEWGSKIQSEQARLAFEQLELTKSIDPQRIVAEFDVKNIELAVQNNVDKLADLVSVYAQITQALFSSAPLSASTSMSNGISIGQNQSYTMSNSLESPNSENPAWLGTGS